MFRREWTAREEEFLREWRQQDVKVATIAKRLSRPFGSVAGKISRMRVIMYPLYARKRRKGLLTRAVHSRLKMGHTVALIATALNVSHSVVSRIRKKLGFPPSTRSERIKLAWVFRKARGDKPPNRWANK